MSGPRTAKDALLAELLGDMDQLLTRFEQSQQGMEQLRVAIERGHEAKASQAARELEAATAKFGETTTRSVDDFVNVANEALAKFMQRTNEIKALLDKQATAPAVTTPTAVPSQHQPQQKEPSSKALKWLFPAIFAGGVVVGVVLALLLAK